MSVESDPQEHIFRSALLKGGDLVTGPVLFHLKEDERTMAHLFEKSVERYGDQPAYGHRDVVAIHEKKLPPENPSDPNSKPRTWQSYELADYKWISFNDAKQIVENIATELLHHGLSPYSRVLFFAKTSHDWFLTALACFTTSITVVTAYDSMGAEAVLHTLKETGAQAIYTEISLMSVIQKVLKSLPKGSIHCIMYSGHEDEGKTAFESITTTYATEIQIIDINELKKKPAGNQMHRFHSPSNDDLACIMYTSGSTGPPKGVELPHQSLVAAIGAAELMVSQFLDNRDVYVGYLPLAHVLELIVECICMTLGVRIGYARVRTLTGGDAIIGPGGHGHGVGDLELLKPTLMAGVPMIWERIKKGMLTKVNNKGWLVSKLFNAAVATKWYIWNWLGYENWITKYIDYFFFSQPRNATGGRLRIALTGGAPLSESTHAFLDSTLCYIIQGYGLTEVTGLGFLETPHAKPRVGSIGYPSPALEVKLNDVPEAGYFAKDRKGEIYIRGPSLMRGYYNQPQLTKEVITEDGWFKTGDIAQVNPDGSFSIIDRAKNLVKLAHGEYIALEKLESIYRDSHAIKNLCIIADSHKEYIIAVVEPSHEGDSESKVLSELQGVAKSQGLNKSETLTKVILSKGKGEWVNAGFLTTSGKVKRKEIKEAFQEEIKKVYK